MFSIIIPVYKNESSIKRLITVLKGIESKINVELEVVFVVDGSPDNSFIILENFLDNMPFNSQIISHSRNFGAFAAIRTGLQHAKGDFFSVLAADLQEPPELILSFFEALKNNECDVAVGKRIERNDPFFTSLFSNLFWVLYKKFIFPEMPTGGVDIFGCNKLFRNQLIKLKESRSSLISLIFWLGFRRKEVEYVRLKRKEGVSSQNWSRKIEYMLDSIFSFTDFPIRMLMIIGLLGIIFSSLLGLIILINALAGYREVPGYATTVIVVLFFGALNTFGLGLVGGYAWRSYENTKFRPSSVIAHHILIEKKNDGK